MREGDYCILAILVAVPDLGLLIFLPPLPKTDKDDLQPSWNSLKLIFASPSISKRLRMPISSCLVATWPALLRKRLRLF